MLLVTRLSKILPQPPSFGVPRPLAIRPVGEPVYDSGKVDGRSTRTRRIPGLFWVLW